MENICHGILHNIVVETGVRELSILPQLISERGRMTGRGRCGLVVGGFLLILLVLVGLLVVRS